MDVHPFKDFRERHGLTQAQLGEKLGLQFPQGRISQFETGARAIPTEVAHDFIALAASHGEKYTLEQIYPRRVTVA